jgi:dihydrofolate reductase
MNKVFIATSLDGYIADKNGQIEWLHQVPNPTGDDMGYSQFMNEIDALIMGRVTFETVLGFDIEWPYQKPVFVLSSTIHEVPKKLENNVFLMKGDLEEILEKIHARGYQNLYIDGGTTIQHFLSADLIDELIITRIPVILGGGTPLFGQLKKSLEFKCIDTKHYVSAIDQAFYRRIK